MKKMKNAQISLISTPVSVFTDTFISKFDE